MTSSLPDFSREALAPAGSELAADSDAERFMSRSDAFAAQPTEARA